MFWGLVLCAGGLSSLLPGAICVGCVAGGLLRVAGMANPCGYHWLSFTYRENIRDERIKDGIKRIGFGGLCWVPVVTWCYLRWTVGPLEWLTLAATICNPPYIGIRQGK